MEPVRYWSALTKITGNIPAAAAVGLGVIYTQQLERHCGPSRPGQDGCRTEMFGHGGNYSTVFLDDPLTGTIIVRQGENNAKGASYLTKNGCAPGWTGTAPTCTPGTDWSNNWGVSTSVEVASPVAGREEGRRAAAGGVLLSAAVLPDDRRGRHPVDNATDVYDSPAGRHDDRSHGRDRGQSP